MRNLMLILSCFFLIACAPSQSNSILTIDLDEAIPSIPYSSFVESIDYLTLNTNDSCLMSGIDKMYIDDGKIFIQDSKKAGVFVFSKDGILLKQINYYGNGPMEFVDINTFSIDKLQKHICIYDGQSRKINKYTYDGVFIESRTIENVIRDFAVFENKQNLFIMPSYRKDMPSGVWIADDNNEKIKLLKNDVPKEDEFEFVFTYYNLVDQSIYYYDRNWDNISYITKDTATTLFQFDLKQSIPTEVRKKADPGLKELAGSAMMANFSYSTNFLVLTYYRFGENPFKWVLVNKDEMSVFVSDRLENDLDCMPSSQSYLFHLNDSTWCRPLDLEESNCNITLQLLHIKK